MLKEIKYLIFIVVILISLFFTVKYYFSDNNIKNSYRSLNNINERLEKYSKKLPILENNTYDIIEYAKQTNKKRQKKFNFWNLLKND